jgi:hypothetical protein
MQLFKSISALTHSHYTFEGIQEGEEVILFLHRHKLTLILKLFGLLMVSILPFFLYPFVEYGLAKVGIEKFLPFVLVLYSMLVWSLIMQTITMYLLDYWIVTNRRILSNTQHGFWKRIVSELQFSKVQDISVKVSGVIETVLRFGDIEIQSAGAVNKFVFEEVAKPHEIKDKIMALVEKRRGESTV